MHVITSSTLQVVPAGVWRINVEPPSDRDTSFTAQDDERWWDQVDLTKLILAANQIKEIPDDIHLLTALTILDVSI
jgi:Leucine-rich repeat (LRR) protein